MHKVTNMEMVRILIRLALDKRASSSLLNSPSLLISLCLFLCKLNVPLTLGMVSRKTSRLVHTLILFHSRLTIPVSRNFVLLFTLAPIVNYTKVQSYGLSEPFSRALIPHRITRNSMQQALLEFSLFIPSGSMPNRFFNRSNSLVSFLRFS